MSDSEVLTLGVVGQWRVGVPWRSERGLVRYIHAHAHAWFPGMLQISGFNYRFRQLWALFARLQPAFAGWLSSAQTVYVCGQFATTCLQLSGRTQAQTAPLVAHNLGIWLNRLLGRPDLALGTLIL